MLVPSQLPASLTSWGGGAAVGTGFGAKAAAVVAAGVVAAGAGHEAADAVDRPTTVPQRHVVVAKSPSGPVTRPVVVQRTKPVRAAKPEFAKGRRIGRPTTLEPVAAEPVAEVDTQPRQEEGRP